MNKPFYRVTLLLALISSMLISAVPAKSDLVRLTIINNSNRHISLKLVGDNFYYLTVEPGDTQIFTPMRGIYTATLYSCGISVSQAFDLTKRQTLIVPTCGTKALKSSPKPGMIDGGELLKLVKVTFKNKTFGYMTLIFKGPQTYVFSFAKGDVKSFTIPKGKYTYWLYGCGTILTASFHAEANKVKEFSCP
ncbi:MAG: hypothetical protein AB1345_08385 [Chloroflexota bacterium]